jgi:uncharacterized membrane protein YqjE
MKKHRLPKVNIIKHFQMSMTLLIIIISCLLVFLASDLYKKVYSYIGLAIMILFGLYICRFESIYVRENKTWILIKKTENDIKKFLVKRLLLHES